MKHKFLATLPAFFGLTLLPNLALAAESADSGGTAWVLNIGALDFAVGIVGHISALVLGLFLGKRNGFAHERIVPHKLPMTLPIVGLLKFGQFDSLSTPKKFFAGVSA